MGHQEGNQHEKEDVRQEKDRKPTPPDKKTAQARTKMIRQWIPNQPGAWVMAIMPPLAGAIIGGFSWRNILLLITWVLCYCTEFTVSRWLVSRMAARFLPPLVTYAILTAIFGLVLLITTPGLLRWVPPYLVLAALTFWAAWKREERSWWNNIVSIIAASTLCLVAYSLGTIPQSQIAPSPGGYFGCQPDPAVNCFAQGLFPARVFPVTGLVATLIFAYTEFGSVLYVKSLVRERNNIWCSVASVVWNVILIGPSIFILPKVGSFPLIVSLLLVARAAALPLIARKRHIPIMRIGMVESIASLLVFLLVITLAATIAAPSLRCSPI